MARVECLSWMLLLQVWKKKKKEKRENRTVPLFFEINYSNIFTNANDHFGNGSAKFYVIFVFSTNT